MNRFFNSGRRYDIDWLRVFSVLLLVPYHSALIFILNPNSIMYIKDIVNSEFLSRAESFVAQFFMPLMFVLSGASTYFSLGSRSGMQYIGERFRRLFIPAAFGIIVLIPPMTYITAIARGDSKSFISHFMGFFRFNAADLAGYSGTFTPAHLWFISFLFIFSVAGLPLFQFMIKMKERRFIKRLGGFFSIPFTLSLLGIPIALAASSGILGDKNPLVYFLLFFYGFLIMTNEGYQKSIARDAPYILIISIVFEIMRQTTYMNFPEWSLPWLLFGLMENLNRWLWVVTILGLGHRFLNAGGPILSYLSEASYPFYILHLPLNTLIGYFIIKLSIGVAPKYILIVFLTTAAVFLVYETFRRMNLFRFLLGMKPLLKRPSGSNVSTDRNV